MYRSLQHDNNTTIRFGAHGGKLMRRHRLRDLGALLDYCSIIFFCSFFLPLLLWVTLLANCSLVFAPSLFPSLLLTSLYHMKATSGPHADVLMVYVPMFGNPSRGSMSTVEY